MDAKSVLFGAGLGVLGTALYFHGYDKELRKSYNKALDDCVKREQELDEKVHAKIRDSIKETIISMKEIIEENGDECLDNIIKDFSDYFKEAANSKKEGENDENKDGEENPGEDNIDTDGDSINNSDNDNASENIDEQQGQSTESGESETGENLEDSSGENK